MDGSRACVGRQEIEQRQNDSTGALEVLWAYELVAIIRRVVVRIFRSVHENARHTGFDEAGVVARITRAATHSTG